MFDTMDIVSGAVFMTGIVSVAAALIDGPNDRKLQSCIDSYTFTGERNSYEFVQCMKGQFPGKFANAYNRKLQSDAKLAEVSQ